MPRWKQRLSGNSQLEPADGLKVIGARMSDVRRESWIDPDAPVLNRRSLAFDAETEKTYRSARVPVQLTTHKWTTAFSFLFLAYFYFYASNDKMEGYSAAYRDGYRRAAPVYLGGAIYFAVLYLVLFTRRYQSLVEKCSHYCILIFVCMPLLGIGIGGRWIAGDGTYSGGVMLISLGAVLSMEKFRPIAGICLLILSLQLAQCLGGSDNTSDQNVMVVLPVAVVLTFSCAACYAIDLSTRRLWIIQRTVLVRSEALKKEKEDAVRLLEAQLPRAVIDQLRGPKGVGLSYSHNVDSASVLFAEFEDWMERTRRLDPSMVVGALNDIFASFDDLALRYGVDKIKTIGPVYMCAAGVTTPTPTHAVDVANLALALVRCVREEVDVAAVVGGITLRVGIHCGPLVAGIVGDLKFCYDIYGDTVNTASRMCKYAPSGTAMVSRDVFDALAPTQLFVFEPLGERNVKGKGVMATYCLTGMRVMDDARTPEEIAAAQAPIAQTDPEVLAIAVAEGADFVESLPERRAVATGGVGGVHGSGHSVHGSGHSLHGNALGSNHSIVRQPSDESFEKVEVTVAVVDDPSLDPIPSHASTTTVAGRPRFVSAIRAVQSGLQGLRAMQSAVRGYTPAAATTSTTAILAQLQRDLAEHTRVVLPPINAGLDRDAGLFPGIVDVQHSVGSSTSTIPIATPAKGQMSSMLARLRASTTNRVGVEKDGSSVSEGSMPSLQSPDVVAELPEGNWFRKESVRSRSSVSASEPQPVRILEGITERHERHEGRRSKPPSRESTRTSLDLGTGAAMNGTVLSTLVSVNSDAGSTHPLAVLDAAAKALAEVGEKTTPPSISRRKPSKIRSASVANEQGRSFSTASDSPLRSYSVTYSSHASNSAAPAPASTHREAVHALVTSPVLAAAAASIPMRKISAAAHLVSTSAPSSGHWPMPEAATAPAAPVPGRVSNQSSTLRGNSPGHGMRAKALEQRDDRLRAMLLECRQSRFTLRFKEPLLESAFRTKMAQRPSSDTLLAMFLPWAAILLLAAIDGVSWAPGVSSERKAWLWGVRFGFSAILLVLPLLQVSLPLLQISFFERHRAIIVDLISAGQALSYAGISIAAASVHHELMDDHYYSYPSLLILVISGCALIPSNSFVHTMVVATVVVVALVILVAATASTATYTSVCLYLITAIALYIAAKFITERYWRSQFVLDAIAIDQEKEIEDERAKDTQLLHNILPPVIARKLAEDPLCDTAQFFPHVTVLVMDIVSFTVFSSSVSANEVVALLNTLFIQFDNVVSVIGAEKICTIGDSYVAASGVPEPTDDHATVVLQLGLSMLDIVDRFNDERAAASSEIVGSTEPVQIRVGIHSGSAVAGIIGGKVRFKYDLYGEALNVATQLEQSGQPGLLHLSATSMPTDAVNAIWTFPFKSSPAPPISVVLGGSEVRLETVLLSLTRENRVSRLDALAP